MKEAGEKAMNEIYLSWDDAVHTAYAAYEVLLDKKKRNLLAEKRPLADDPLFEMAADAAKRYADVMLNDLPGLEGMLDNLHQQVRSEIRERKKEVLDSVEELLRKLQ